jgi:hypothetical protein
MICAANRSPCVAGSDTSPRAAFPSREARAARTCSPGPAARPGSPQRRATRRNALNPLKHIVDSVRALFPGDTSPTTGITGTVMAVGLVIGGRALGSRPFQRESG